MKISDLSSSKPKKLQLNLDKEAKYTEDNSTKSVKSEFQSLKDKMNYIENRRNSQNNPLLLFLKSVDQTEKEIEEIEKSIRRTPIKLNRSNYLHDLDQLKAKLTIERQNNYLFKKESQNLKRKLEFKPNLSENLISLKNDYNSLMESFKRSENIRKKQKKLIKELKNELIGTKMNKKKSKKHKKKLKS